MKCGLNVASIRVMYSLNKRHSPITHIIGIEAREANNPDCVGYKIQFKPLYCFWF